MVKQLSTQSFGQECGSSMLLGLQESPG